VGQDLSRDYLIYKGVPETEVGSSSKGLDDD